MAAEMAKEVRPYNVAVDSIWMGGLDTERARARFAGTRWRPSGPYSRVHLGDGRGCGGAGGRTCDQPLLSLGVLGRVRPGWARPPILG